MAKKTEIRWQEMLESCWQRLAATYWDRGRRGFYESRPRRLGDPVWAYNWGFGAVLAAASSIWKTMAGPDFLARDIDGLASVLSGYELGGPFRYSSTTRLARRVPGDVFYDDNAWIGLAALDFGALADWESRAALVFRFMLQGVDATSGGVFWKERPRASLHVCSTGPAALLGAQLYRREPEAWDFNVVQNLMRWLQTMRAPDGRYWDNLNVVQGRIDKTLHTYNCGTPLHAMAVLEGLPECGFRAEVEDTVGSLGAFLDASGRLPPTPWFNAVLLRGLKAVKEVYGIEPPLLEVYRQDMQDAISQFRRGNSVLKLESRDDRRDGIMVRDAAAAIEILALLAGWDR